MSSDERNESDAGAPKRRETLAERFQRIMGFSFDQVTGEQDQKDDSRRKKSSTKRRDQILQAQRSHRQRTQLYIRELEKEVLRLRGLVETAHAKLAKLGETAAHDIEQSLQYSDSTNPTGSPASTFTDTVTVDLTALADAKAEPACDIGPPFTEPPAYTPGSIALKNSVAPSAADSMPVEMDSQAAVDFILALEGPCLGHVKYAYLSGHNLDPTPDMFENYGIAHAFNISSSLVQGPYTIDPTSAPFQVPKFDVDNLLASSHNLGLSQNEMTPVQIWASLRNFARSRAFTRDMLLALTTELSRYSRCNGFGTVVDKNIVDSIFAVVFA